MTIELPPCDPKTKIYFEELIEKSNALYTIAEGARAQGKDLTKEVEIQRASNLAVNWISFKPAYVINLHTKS